MKEMYKPQPFSPSTKLAQTINPSDTIIKVEDITVFPPAPNLATIGNDENAEVVRYNALTENSLSGVERGITGAAAAWAADEPIARNFNSIDYQNFIDNINELNTKKVDGVDGKGLSANDYTDVEKQKLSGIAAGANAYTHPATHPVSMIIGLPTSLPANGGNAATVNGKTVDTSVPVNALFTDTLYTHPTTHPASMIVQDAGNRFTTDAEKTAWNTVGAKADKTQLPKVTAVSIAKAAFVADTTYVDYPLRATIPITGVLAADSVDINLDVLSVSIANEAEVSSATIAYGGGVYMYAKEAPKAALTGFATVTKGGA